MAGDVGNRIRDLKKRFAALKAVKDYDKTWDMLSEMHRSIVGGNPDGSRWAHTDEEWETIFEKYMGMTKEQFFEAKQRREI